MVTALSEFTKKLILLAFKNMLTTWTLEDIVHKENWLWFWELYRVKTNRDGMKDNHSF
jgi:hypothetical protein